MALNVANPQQDPPSRTHYIRYDLKVTYKPRPSSTAEAALIKQIKGVLEHLMEEDPKLVLLPWSSNSTSPAVLNKADLLTTRSSSQGYVPHFFTLKDGGVFYTSIHLGHNKSFEILQTKLAEYLESMHTGIYQKALQCEESICIGWLLYSVPSINLAYLDCKQQTGINVALCFQKCSLQL